LADQHLAGQPGVQQNGVNIARYNLPSPPQTLTPHWAPVQAAVQSIPGVQALAFFFAASADTPDNAIADTATAQTNRIFESDFMMGAPPLL
jgi:hypothetical protein